MPSKICLQKMASLQTWRLILALGLGIPPGLVVSSEGTTFEDATPFVIGDTQMVTVDVTFTPSAAGARSATLTIESLDLPAHIRPKRWDKVFYFPDEQAVYHTPEYSHLFTPGQVKVMERAIAHGEPFLAGNGYAQLDWIYRHSPYYEPAHMQVPVCSSHRAS